jgi:hypothetical protein
MIKYLSLIFSAVFLFGVDTTYHGIIKEKAALNECKILREGKEIKSTYLLYGDTIYFSSNVDLNIFLVDPVSHIHEINDSTITILKKNIEEKSFLSLAKDYVNDFFSPINHIENNAITLRSTNSFHSLNSHLIIPVDKKYSLKKIDIDINKVISEMISKNTSKLYYKEISQILNENKTITMKLAIVSTFLLLISTHSEDDYYISGYHLLVANQKYFKSEEERNIYRNLLQQYISSQ